MNRTPKPSHKTLHPTVGTRIVLNSGRESINIGFTDQKLSPHAGCATFWSFLRPRGFIKKLQAVLPQPEPMSNNHISPLDEAMGFIQGLLRDPVVPEIMGIKRIASQSSFSRFFAGFDTAGKNQRPWWERLWAKIASPWTNGNAVGRPPSITRS